MDPQVSPSFIPKKSLASAGRTPHGAGASLIMLIAILIFLISFVAAGGAFVYKQYLKSAINSKSAALQKARGAYGSETIQDLLRLDTRLLSGKKILATHSAPSGIFAFLSANTLEKVSFYDFSFTVDSEGKGKLTLEGQAPDFSTIALQSDQFGASKVMRDIIFSDLVIEPKTGRVTFTVDASVEPSLYLYSQTFQNQNPSASVQTTSASEDIEVPSNQSTTTQQAPSI